MNKHDFIKQYMEFFWINSVPRIQKLKHNGWEWIEEWKSHRKKRPDGKGYVLIIKQLGNRWMVQSFSPMDNEAFSDRYFTTYDFDEALDKGEEWISYVYVCNECEQLHEDETESCELCGGSIRVVSRGDLGLN